MKLIFIILALLYSPCILILGWIFWKQLKLKSDYWLLCQEYDQLFEQSRQYPEVIVESEMV